MKRRLVDPLARMTRATIDYESYFVCDPVSGVVCWKDRPDDHFKTYPAMCRWRAMYVGKAAGYLMPCGYVRVIVTPDGMKQVGIYAHRIVWEMTNGPIPSGYDVDHINGVKHDNRLSNLRLATRQQNSFNRGPNKSSTTGIKGVFDRGCGKRRFLAAIGKDYGYIFLGYFKTIEEAKAAYDLAAAEIQGEFIHKPKP